MLQLSAELTNQKVISLRTSGQIALATEPIINPTNLKIEGFYCIDKFSKNQLILLTQDIREKAKQCFFVNDHEVLAEPDELIRLKDILKLQFSLVGLPVITVNKNKLGKVNDYAVDDASLYVQKLYIGQSLFKSIGRGGLSVDRNQIVEITDKKIVIQDPMKPVEDAVPAGAPAAA